MTYVRKKRTGEREYYQLVMGRRENGLVRQKVIVHLGKHPTAADAAEAWRSELDRISAIAAKNESEEKMLAEHLLQTYPDILESKYEGDIPAATTYWEHPWHGHSEKCPMKFLTPHIASFANRAERDAYEAEYKAQLDERKYDGEDIFEEYFMITFDNEPIYPFRADIRASSTLYWRYKKQAEKLRKRADKLQAKLDKLESFYLSNLSSS